MADSFTLALAQMEVVGGDLQRNLDHAVELISDAKTGGADVVLLPECMDLGWTHPSAKELATSIPSGRVTETLKQAAREHQLMICSGVTEAAGQHVYNAAVLIDATGELLCHHRKIHELEIAHDLYDLGTSLNVVDTAFGKRHRNPHLLKRVTLS